MTMCARRPDGHQGHRAEKDHERHACHERAHHPPPSEVVAELERRERQRAERGDATTKCNAGPPPLQAELGGGKRATAAHANDSDERETACDESDLRSKDDPDERHDPKAWHTAAENIR